MGNFSEIKYLVSGILYLDYFVEIDPALGDNIMWSCTLNSILIQKYFCNLSFKYVCIYY